MTMHQWNSPLLWKDTYMQSGFRWSIINGGVLIFTFLFLSLFQLLNWFVGECMFWNWDQFSLQIYFFLNHCFNRILTIVCQHVAGSTESPGHALIIGLSCIKEDRKWHSSHTAQHYSTGLHVRHWCSGGGVFVITFPRLFVTDLWYCECQFQHGETDASVKVCQAALANGIAGVDQVGRGAWL